ncbi:MAG: archease [Ignisphaera sp.]|uniref:Protein archease n=1 Tax=Ignisphaera aggregans TaxID=334771 RepID=A0A7C4JIY6_9CREN
MYSGKLFEFLEHTADVLVRSYGETFKDALSNIAKGMFEIITDTTRIEAKISIDVSICGFDLENLVYKWLEELLYYHDAYNYVFSEFDIKSISEELLDGEKVLCLKAQVRGEEFDDKKHEPRTVVKAVTYHQMRVEKSNNKWIIDVVFDI